MIPTKTPDDLARIDALVIPGGESTAISGLAEWNGLLSKVRDRIGTGMPVLGTCAGIITLAKTSYDRVGGKTAQPSLGVLDVTVERNSFGRQRESFEVDLNIPRLGKRPFRGVFIRAPKIKETSKSVEILARLDKTVVAVRQRNILGTCFHPELSGETRFHEYFLKTARELLKET